MAEQTLITMPPGMGDRAKVVAIIGQRTKAKGTTPARHLDTGAIGDRGYEIVNAARLLQLLAVSDIAEGSHVPMPLQDLFQQVRYLGRQIETHAKDIITAADKGGAR